jgi:prepilin-type N-terminal cleavage/methylation domain-containing protein
MNRRRRGFTLVEVLVSLAVFGTVTAGLFEVLSLGNRSLARTRPADRTPGLQAAWLQVRLDVQSAGSVSDGGREWSEAPLELAVPDGRRLRLLLRDGVLVREERSHAGDVSTRTLARPVRAVRWRLPAHGLVEVELSEAAPFDADRVRVGPARISSVVCALRGAGREVASW